VTTYSDKSDEAVSACVYWGDCGSIGVARKET
jgi:hypothetical protein